MSSFWNFFSSKENAEGQAADGDESDRELGPAEGSTTAPTMPPAPKPTSTAPSTKTPSTSPKALPPKPAYGIDDAIRLMRTLPVDQNVDLVVRVVKNTLESLHVRVSDILADAGKRQDTLRENISDLETAITHFQREIEERRQEISRLQDELSETSSVRERLQLAEATAAADDAGRSKPPPPKPAALPGILVTPATPPPAPTAAVSSSTTTMGLGGSNKPSGAAPPLPPTRRVASTPPKDETPSDRPDTPLPHDDP